jgi:hypothetical protein
MGKLFGFVTILIFMEIAFLFTGLFFLGGEDSSTFGSIILDGVLNFNDISTLNFWKALIGLSDDPSDSQTGILALLTGSAVIAGALLSKNDTLLFIALAGTLAFLALDFIAFGSYLYSINEPLAIIIMVPIILLFSLTILEWVKNKD